MRGREFAWPGHLACGGVCSACLLGGFRPAWHLCDDLCGGHLRRQKLKPNGETKARRGREFYGAWRVCASVSVGVCP